MLSGFGSEVIGCAVPVPAGLPPSPALCAVKRTNPSSSSLFPCNCPHDTSPAGKCQGGFSGCVPREQRALAGRSGQRTQYRTPPSHASCDGGCRKTMSLPGAARTAVAISRIFNCLSGRFPHQSADRFGMTAIGGTFLTRIVPSFHSAGDSFCRD